MHVQVEHSGLLRCSPIKFVLSCSCTCYVFAMTSLLFIFNDVDAVPRSTIDDEYANAPEKDPKILLTTSRNPSGPLTQFVKVGVPLNCPVTILHYPLLTLSFRSHYIENYIF